MITSTREQQKQVEKDNDEDKENQKSNQTVVKVRGYLVICEYVHPLGRFF